MDLIDLALDLEDKDWFLKLSSDAFLKELDKPEEEPTFPTMTRDINIVKKAFISGKTVFYVEVFGGQLVRRYEEINLEGKSPYSHFKII